MNNRRPISTRHTSFAIKTSSWLGVHGVKPNQLSLMSMVFSLLAAICLFITPHYESAAYFTLLISAVIFITLRLGCNLFDGMLAIEGGAVSKFGELYNDLPDRPSDVLILVAVGKATGISFGITMGFIAAILALMTAYIRLSGSIAGSKQYFTGPMAKQHRMAVVIIACILSALIGKNDYSSWIMISALMVIILGAILTSIRRLEFIINDIKND